MSQLFQRSKMRSEGTVIDHVPSPRLQGNYARRKLREMQDLGRRMIKRRNWTLGSRKKTSSSAIDRAQQHDTIGEKTTGEKTTGPDTRWKCNDQRIRSVSGGLVTNQPPPSWLRVVFRPMHVVGKRQSRQFPESFLLSPTSVKRAPFIVNVSTDTRGKLTADTVDGTGSTSELKPDNDNFKQRATSSPSSERGRVKRAVEVACWPCRKRKAKCSGERPSCGPCTQRGVECAYEYEEGLTKVGWLKMKLDEATAKTNSLEFLFEQLRTRSDEESSMILAIIRLGADLEKVVSQLKEAPQEVFSKDNSLNIDQLMTDSGDAGFQEAAATTPSAATDTARGRIP
ncbi:hypothetical protein BST61_g7736 [Cercospora zeina]